MSNINYTALIEARIFVGDIIYCNNHMVGKDLDKLSSEA